MEKVMAAPKKILIINIFGIGDVLFTTPVIRNIKEAFPDCQIGYLCNQRAKAVIENHPHIRRIFVYERDAFQGFYQQSKLLFIRKMKELFDDIRQENYDMVIDVSLNSFTSFLSWQVGIKRRIGYNYKNRSFLLNKRKNLTGYEQRHVVEYYCELLTGLGIAIRSYPLEIFLDKQDELWADEFIKSHDLKRAKRMVGLIPGGGASWGQDARYKRWPPENYAKIADNIIEKFSAAIILFGDKGELDLCQKVAALMTHRPVSACGVTTIRQMAALAKRCSFVLLNDGGPLHICSAVGARKLTIFGPVDEVVYGPYPAEPHNVIRSEIVCRPCYRRFRKASCDHVSCLNFIKVEDVLRKVEEII